MWGKIVEIMTMANPILLARLNIVQQSLLAIMDLASPRTMVGHNANGFNAAVRHEA